MTIPDINNKRELDDVLQKLRLRELPFTLDTIESIRVAIKKPNLDDLIRKYMEREFTIRWQELCIQNKLEGWPSGYGQPFSIKSKKEPSISIQIFTNKNSKKDTTSKHHKKKGPKTKQNNKPNSPKDQLGLFPNKFTSPDELEGCVHFFTNHPKFIPEYIKIIAPRISGRTLRRTFCERLVDIYITKVDNKKRKKHVSFDTQKNKSVNTKPTITRSSSQGVYLNKNNKQQFKKADYSAENSKIYETYEYGLSDW